MHHAATFSFSQSEKRYRATSRRIPVPMRASSRFPETFSAKQTNKQTNRVPPIRICIHTCSEHIRALIWFSMR